MSLAICVTLVLGAAAPATAPVKVASPGLTGINIDGKNAAYYTEHFSTQLALTGMQVSLPSDIAAVLGVERQKQLLGCSDESACLTELAGALGVDALVTGSVASFSDTWQITIRVISATDGSVLAQAAGRAQGKEVALLDELTAVAKRVGADLFKTLGRKPDVTLMAKPEAKEGAAARLWWIPLAIGGAAGIGGGVIWYMAKAKFDELDTGMAKGVNASNIASVVAGGRSLETIGWVLFGVAGAGIVAGVVTLAVGRLTAASPPAESPKVMLVPSLNGFALVGTWP